MFIKSHLSHFFNVRAVDEFRVVKFDDKDSDKYVIEFIVRNEKHLLVKQHMFVPTINIDDKDIFFDTEDEARWYLERVIKSTMVE